MGKGVIRECSECFRTREHGGYGLCRTCYKRRYYALHGRVRQPRKCVWSAERIERLTSLFNEGMPLSQIAEAFGVSKNTISGICWRKGLSRKPGHTTTSAQRLDALWVSLDAAMALPVPRVKDPPAFIERLEYDARMPSKSLRLTD